MHYIKKKLSSPYAAYLVFPGGEEPRIVSVQNVVKKKWQPFIERWTP